MRTGVLLLAALAAAGCGGGDGGESRVISPATALGVSAGEEVTVRGYFSREPGTIVPRMCDALDPAYPPTCSMPSLPVSNLSDAAEQALQLTRDPETGARWSQRQVELSGRIQDGALVVD